MWVCPLPADVWSLNNAPVVFTKKRRRNVGSLFDQSVFSGRPCVVQPEETKSGLIRHLACPAHIHAG